MGFSGFTQADFTAFEESKWSSNAFNRERLEVKLKLSELGRELAPGLFSKLPEQEMGMTEERPSIFNQHKVDSLALFFIRDAESRKDLALILDRATSIADHVSDPALQHRHIAFTVRLRREGVEAGIFLHKNAWVDWQNVVHRCREHFEREKFMSLLAALPESISYQHGERLRPSATLDEFAEPEIIACLEQADPWSFFGKAFEKDDAVLESRQLVDEIRSVFECLVPLHSFVAWRRDNDFHELREKLKQQKEKAQRKFSSVKVGDQVRILKGLASGRVGVVESIERKGVVKVRLGTIVVAVSIEELGKP